MTRAQVGDHLRNEERVKAWRAISSGVNFNLFLKSQQASDSGSPDYACPVWVKVLKGEVRVFDGLIRNHHRILRKGVHFSGLLTVYVGTNIKIFYFAGEPGLIESGIESSNQGGTAGSVLQSFPVLRNGFPDRRECTKPCDYYSLQSHDRWGVVKGVY